MGIILGGRRGGRRSAAEGRRSCAGEQLPDHRVPPFLPRLPQLWPLPLPALETRRLPEGPTKGAERSGPFRLGRPVTGALPPQEGTPTPFPHSPAQRHTWESRPLAPWDACQPFPLCQGRPQP